MLRNMDIIVLEELYSGFTQSWSETNKVHLVGHSMGGQTIRNIGTDIKRRQL